MANSMQHWNGHQLVAIDIETGGLDPYYHEILQIAILPLDSNIQVRRDVMPFYIEMAPDYPQRVEPEAIKKNGLDLIRITGRGFDSDKAKDLLEDWVNKLKLPYTNYGNRKRLMPLAHNWQFDSAFIKRWLGMEMFSDIFDGRARDTQETAAYLNDRAAMRGDVVPFSKINLSWLCNKLNVENAHAHDALQDCIATAEVYRRLLMSQGIVV